MFFELVRTCGFSLELQWGTHVASGKSSLHSSCKGERSITLKPWQGNRALRRVQRGISRSFSSCSRKPWVPETYDGELSELLRVSMGSQDYCGVGRSISALHWVWCNGRRPHLGLRREPQVSSPLLTWVSGCVCHFKQGVKSQRVWRHGTLLCSRVVNRVSGLQPS